MTAFSVENPVFVAYMIVAAIMILKIMGHTTHTLAPMPSAVPSKRRSPPADRRLTATTPIR
jgi:hypothetical protein